MPNSAVSVQVYINNYDVSLMRHFQTVATRLKAWFEHGHGAGTRSLTIDLSRAWIRWDWSSGKPALFILWEVFKEFVCDPALQAVEPRLQRLSLRGSLGMATAASFWHETLAKYGKYAEVPWPCLEELTLIIERQSGSDAGAATSVQHVLSSLNRPQALRRAAIILRDIHLTTLPAQLAQATQLEELELRFCGCKGAGRVPLLLPATPPALHFPPNVKVLKFTNSPFFEADVLAAAHRQCPRLRLLELGSDT